MQPPYGTPPQYYPGCAPEPCGPQPGGPPCGPVVFNPPQRPGPEPVPVTVDPLDAASLLSKLPPLTVNAGPYQAPPFRSHPITLRYRAVMLPIAGDAVASAGCTELTEAETWYGVTNSYTIPQFPAAQPASADAYVVLPPDPSFVMAQNETGAIREVILSAHAFEALRGLQLVLRVSGQNYLGQPQGVPRRFNIYPAQYLAAASEMPLRIPVMVPIPPRSVLSIELGNMDNRSGVYFELALNGWRWPIVSPVDGEQATALGANANPEMIAAGRCMP